MLDKSQNSYLKDFKLQGPTLVVIIKIFCKPSMNIIVIRSIGTQPGLLYKAGCNCYVFVVLLFLTGINKMPKRVLCSRLK